MISGNPTIQRRGVTSNVQGAMPVGTVVVVTGVANVSGVILRTIFLNAPAGGALNLTSGGVTIFNANNNGVFTYSGPGVLIPPGQALELITVAVANAQSVLTYDIL